jgi:nicotinamide phosphoribosyltransferase
MTIIAPTMQKDVYKEFHRQAYHPNVTTVYSNYTNRNGKLSNINNNEKVCFVGLQYFIMSYLIEEWKRGFFQLDKNNAVKRHKRILSSMLGYDIDVSYLEKLHDLGYLPLHIKALEEGTMVPYGVSPMTISNTLDGFQWLTNMIETVISCESWPIQTSATTSIEYFRNFKKYFDIAGVDQSLIQFMGHDFSFRGMFGKQAAAMSGFGHLCSGFVGTDTIPAVLFAENYYGADCETELVGCSVNATEHSVTCSWQEEGEESFIKYLMNEVSQKGILSIVADTWDFWNLVTNILPKLKDCIMNREGKVVIRPDSGDPVDIICGTYETDGTTPEQKGLIECLWDIFGGTQTEKGFKLLDEHIGAIYGDAITLDRQVLICEKLINKGFAPTVVLGIGSYSYQYVTRDTHGSAIKATSVVKEGERKDIFKDPKTDSKKKSAKGLLRVEMEDGELIMYDQQTEEQEKQGLLKTVFLDGELKRKTNLRLIRELVRSQI